ncbi:MAG TPA: four helix bundle protein [Actinobacteria bacterium]|nr:four helix bundle protein [Actinomycetes bacterium]HEX21445.1 four helix bundle protein [Actinomycetota bacterium]
MNKDIKSYKDLIVWQKAHVLAKQVLYSLKNFPKSDEARIIKQQLIRSTLSVPSNIAEGFGGIKGNSYRNYLTIAKRSLAESDYWLFLSFDLSYIEEKKYFKANSVIQEINAMLNSIINKLNTD